MRENWIKQEIANFEPRRSYRFDLGAMGQVVLVSGTSSCRVVEISHHGARLETDARIRIGEDGLLRCDGLDLLFRAIRYERGSVVIEFVDELAEADGEIDPAHAALIENNRQILRFLDI